MAIQSRHLNSMYSQRVAKTVHLAVIALFVTACATNHSTLVPITVNTHVIKAIGYEVSPPRGNYWFSYHYNQPGWVEFRKQDPAKASLPKGNLLSFVVEIKAEQWRDYDLTTPAGLEAALKFGIYENPNKYKYSTPLFEHYSWQGTNCIKYEVSREEPDTVNGELITFRWDVKGFFCRHPDSRQIGVMGFFQERRPLETPSLLDAQLRKETESVLDSVRFIQID